MAWKWGDGCADKGGNLTLPLSAAGVGGEQEGRSGS